MRKLRKLVARMPVVVTVAASVLSLVMPAVAQDVSKPVKQAPAKKAPAKEAPANEAPSRKSAPAASRAPSEQALSVESPVEAEQAFAEPPAMIPSELEEPEMAGAPGSLDEENRRIEVPAKRLDRLRVQPRVRRARLGAVVERAQITDALSALGVASGIRVKELIEGTPAQRDGMLPGDIITRVEGRPIARATDAMKALSGHAPGRVVAVRVIRSGKPILLRLKLDHGTQVVKPSSSSAPSRLHRLRKRRGFRVNMRQWRRNLRRRHRTHMRQLYRRRY